MTVNEPPTTALLDGVMVKTDAAKSAEGVPEIVPEVGSMDKPAGNAVELVNLTGLLVHPVGTISGMVLVAGARST